MTTAALAATVAVPTLAATPVAAEETSIQHVAIETADGSVVTVPFMDYAKAKTFGSGELGEFVNAEGNSVVAVSVAEGKFVTISALAKAKIMDSDKDTTTLLDELDEDAENLVAEEEVTDYTAYEDLGEDVAPAVESVSANNLSQFTVEFNTEVSEASATKAENYSVDTDGSLDLTNASFELQADGKTVLVTVVDGNEAAQQEKVSVTVENVENTEGAVIEDTTVEDVKFLDQVVPTADSAEVVGNDTIKVHFSEPMDVASLETKGNYEVNGGDLYIKEVNSINNGREANIVLYSDLEEGDVDVSVDGVDDQAGFTVDATDLTAEVTVDDEAPQVVGYKDATPNGVTLVFNEDIELADGTAANFYHTNSNNPVDNNITASDIDGNELTLDFTTNNLPEGTAYIYILKESLNDLWDNENNQIMHKVEVEVDEKAPTLDDFEVKSESKVELTFSEDVADVEASDFTLLDNAGDEVEDAIDSVSVTDNVVTVNFENKLSGDHGLVFEGIEDISGNEIDKTTKGFNVDDLTAPKFSDFDVTLYGAGTTDQVVRVDFGEEMATDGQYSVLDASKYIVNGNPLSNYSVDFTVVNSGKSIEIEVPNDANDGVDLVSGSNQIELARVADAAGNYTDQLSATKNLTNGDASTIGYSAELISDEEVRVTFDAELVDFDADDLMIYADELGGDAATNNDYDGSSEKLSVSRVSTSLNAKGNTVAVYTLNSKVNEDAYNTYQTNDLRVTTVASGLTSKNIYGQKLAADDDVAVTDKATPVLDVTTVAGANAQDVVLQSKSSTENKIDITFSEDIDIDTVSASTFDVDGYTVDSIVQTSDSDVITLVLDNSGNYEAPEIGTAITQQASLKDVNGNVLTGLSTEIVDDSLPTVSSATTVDADDDGQIDGYTVVFDEAVKDSSVDISKFDVNSYSNLAFNTGSTSNDNTITITFDESGSVDSDSTPQFTTTSAGAITDLAGNELATVATGSEVDGVTAYFTSGEPTATAGTSPAIDLTADLDVAGTAYYVVVADGANAPTAAEIKAGANYSGVTVQASGSLSVTTPGTQATGSETLTATTAYDVYFVAEDTNGTNLSTNVVKKDVTTN